MVKLLDKLWLHGLLTVYRERQINNVKISYHDTDRMQFVLIKECYM